jgi:hypothetical protein
VFAGGLSRFSLDASLIEARLDEALSRPRHFAVGETYAQHFDAWVSIDLERGGAENDHVVRRLFAAIGVDTQFDHPAFRVSENTEVHHVMVQNWIAVEVLGLRSIWASALPTV